MMLILMLIIMLLIMIIIILIKALRSFQLQHKLTLPIWSLDYVILSKLNYWNNHSATIVHRMSSLDLSLQYCRDEDQWSIIGHSPEITQLFLDAPDLPAHVLRSFWSSNHNTYRLATTRNTFRNIRLLHPCSLHGSEKERMDLILEFIHYARDWKNHI